MQKLIKLKDLFNFNRLLYRLKGHTGGNIIKRGGRRTEGQKKENNSLKKNSWQKSLSKEGLAVKGVLTTGGESAQPKKKSWGGERGAVRVLRQQGRNEKGVIYSRKKSETVRG